MGTMGKNKWKDGIFLFLFFARIGCFTFGGGWSILAQMEQEFIDKRKLISKDDLVEMVAVGKSVPGLMITNVSMIFGYQIAGIWGGLCSVLGISFPAIVILSLVTWCYDLLKNNYWAAAVLKGISCAVVPIIGSSGISLGRQVFKDHPAIVICAIGFVLCYFTSVSNIWLIAGGAVIGLAWMKLDKLLPKKASGKTDSDREVKS